MTQHVLVVDDDDNIRTVVRQTLELEQCAVECASNGREALSRIAADPPAVMLLDMRMPVLSGWDVARVLQEQGMAVPIVVMTAAQDARRWAQEIAAVNYLSKPFDIDHLLAIVAQYVDCPPCAS